jgi:histone acetyltransferase 1
LELFLIFFLNAASTINKEDPNWIIYLLYQQSKNYNGEICYTPIGFTKVYLFYAHPNKKRARIR